MHAVPVTVSCLQMTVAAETTKGPAPVVSRCLLSSCRGRLARGQKVSSHLSWPPLFALATSPPPTSPAWPSSAGAPDAPGRDAGTGRRPLLSRARAPRATLWAGSETNGRVLSSCWQGLRFQARPLSRLQNKFNLSVARELALSALFDPSFEGKIETILHQVQRIDLQ